MRMFKAVAGFGAIVGMTSGAAVAQIDIAALAQFKYNQQHALAASLGKAGVARAGAVGKPGGHTDGAPAAAGRPAVIHAEKRTFQHVAGVSHRKNVR